MKILFYFAFLFFLGCQSKYEKMYQLGKKSIQRSDYFTGVSFFEKAYEELKHQNCDQKCFILAGEIANLYIYQIKNPIQALHWLKIQRQLAQNDSDFILVQKQIIQLQIDYLNDFHNTVIESYRLLNFNLELQDYCETIFSLSWALFELKNKEEALSELSQCLGNIPVQESLAFKLAKLEVDILISQKKYNLVIDRLKMLIKLYSHLDKESGLRFLLALVYEENGEFSKAYSLLDEILAFKISDPKYVELRKQRLKFKEQNQAGAKLRKKIN